MSTGARSSARPRWIAAGLLAVGASLVLGVAVGPISLPPLRVAAELLDHIPFVDIDSGLTPTEANIVWLVRLPRVVLALLVGAMLALAGGCYQGVFRNPLADPMLLGVASGAGLGATLFITARAAGMPAAQGVLPIAAFAGAVGALMLTYLIGGVKSGGRNPTRLILAGVAVTSLLSAVQTYVQQRNADAIRQVYSWLLGRLSVSGWEEVLTVLPYVAVTTAVVLVMRRELDVLTVGDDEAAGLGLHPQRSRYILLAAASLGTAAAVSVAGLIGFVGIVVPHIVRLLAGPSYRSILPLSVLFGGTFLVLADLVARTAVAPGELPIGVVTAFAGAPFFILVMRTTRQEAV
ncbi:iron ABC transporter permease [Phytomonospora sp. NPDC050363]|uniref:FecCD family ABC transporter permease n=1 Tax=Phytomonospora sp. NPDC050363 TaxID=3155642 RepID=UPI0033DBF8E5